MIRRMLALAAIVLNAGVTAQAADLAQETLQAYVRYIDGLRQSFDQRATAGTALIDLTPSDDQSVLRDGGVSVHAGHEDGIIDVPGGLIHHWKGVIFIPNCALDKAVEVSQHYAAYKQVYEPVLDARVLEQDGDTFYVLTRLHKRSGPVGAVLDVWSTVEYRRAPNLIYSWSNSIRIAEIENVGKPGEVQLPDGQGHGYLWRANTFSRFSRRDSGVLVELENVGLSRRFPPLLGWIIEPIARRLGKGSVEDSLRQFRAAVLSQPEISASPSHTASAPVRP